MLQALNNLENVCWQGWAAVSYLKLLLLLCETLTDLTSSKHWTFWISVSFLLQCQMARAFFLK